MKKLMVAAIAIASAVGIAWADLNDTQETFESMSVSNRLDIANGGGDRDWATTDETATVGDAEYVEGTDVKLYTNDDVKYIKDDVAQGADKYLWIDGLANGLERYAQTGGGACNIPDGVYIDTLVKFTATEDEAPSVESGDKLCIWLRKDDDVTNTLMVTAGYIYNDEGNVISNVYETTKKFVGSEVDAWHRLVVRVIPSIDNDDGLGALGDGYVVMVDDEEIAYTGEYAICSEMLLETVLDDTPEKPAATLHTAKKLFPSLLMGSNSTNAKITSVTFRGTGGIDNLQFTTENPYPPATYALTLPTVVNANATVTTIVDGQAQEVSDLTAIAAGTEVLVTWAAATGYQITAGATQNITMNSNVTADEPTVAPITFSITIASVAHATCTVIDGAGNVINDLTAIPYGTTVTVTYTADAGYKLSGKATGTYTLTDNLDLTQDPSWNTSTDQVIAMCGTDEYISLREAIGAVDADATITLVADDRVSFTTDTPEIGINKAITIDGQGYTLYGVSDYAGGSGDHDIYISGSSDITIKNLTLAEFGNAKVPNNHISPIWSGQAYSGNLTVDSVTVTNYNHTALNFNGGTVVVTNCTIVGDTTPRGAGENYYQRGICVYRANVTVVDTTIEGVGAGGSSDPRSNGAGCFEVVGSGENLGYGTINVVSGDYEGQFAALVGPNGSGTISIADGTFDGIVQIDEGSAGSIVISGGLFDAPFDNAYCAEGLVCVESEVQGYWTVGAAPETYTLTIPVVTNELGVVIATAEVTTNGAAVADITAIVKGTTVVVTWTAEDGYEIADGEDTEEITMNSDKTAATPTVTAVSGGGGWVKDPEDIPADTPAGEQYPELADTALAEADAKVLTEWAQTYSVAFDDAKGEGVAGDLTEAFLLNCANTEEAIAKEKKEFVLNITIGADGTPTVTTPVGKVYNGNLQMKGSNDLTTWTGVKSASKTYQFYRYVLSL